MMTSRIKTAFSLGLFLIIVIALGFAIQPGASAQEGPAVPEPYTTGVFPRAMAFDGQNVWIANWADNTVTILNATTGEHVKTLPEENVGKQPVALAWDGSYMWIASYLDSKVFRIDANGTLVETLDNANHGVQQPIDLLFDGSHIWILNQGTGARRGTLLKIDAPTVLLIGTYTVGRYPTALTWDRESVWVANGEDNSLTVIDASTGETKGLVEVNDFPISLAFDGIHVWVAHYDGTIALVRNLTREVVENIVIDELPGRTIELLYAFERIWITNADALSVANLKALNGELSNTEVAGQFPGTLVATNTQVWVANWLDYRITTIDGMASLQNTENPVTAFATDVAVLLPSPVFTLVPTLAPIRICNPAMPSRLRPGDLGQIDEEGDTASLNLRNQPNLDSRIVKTYPLLTTFVVLAGPRCDEDNNAWYQVRIDEDSNEGWFIEAIGEDYTIEPIDQQ